MAKINIVISQGHGEASFKALHALASTAVAAGDSVSICLMAEGHVFGLKSCHK